MNIKDKAAEIVYNYRKEHKLTQAKMAKLAKVSPRSVFGIEKKQTVKDETMRKVLAAAGYDFVIIVKKEIKKKEN